MADRVIGMDVGATGIKLAEVENDNGIHIVTKQAFMPLDPGLVVSGDVADADVPVIAADLKAFLSAEKFTAKRCVVGLNGSSGIFANRAITDWHQPKDMLKAIGFAMIADRSLLVGAPDDVVFDYVVFEEFKEDDDRKLDLLLVGATPGLVERMTGIAKKAGLNAVGAEPNAFAVLRAIRTANRPVGNLDILVDLGQDVVSVLIHECGRPYALTLINELGGRDLDRMIADATQNDDPLLAARSKVVRSGNPLVNSAVDEYMFKVGRALESAFGAYEQTSRSAIRPAGITLTGGGALTPFMADSIRNMFQVQVVQASLDPEIGGGPERYLTGDIISYDYTAAIGLAMGETI